MLGEIAKQNGFKFKSDDEKTSWQSTMGKRLKDYWRQINLSRYKKDKAPAWFRSLGFSGEGGGAEAEAGEEEGEEQAGEAGEDEDEDAEEDEEEEEGEEEEQSEEDPPEDGNSDGAPPCRRPAAAAAGSIVYSFGYDKDTGLAYRWPEGSNKKSHTE
eukprot:8719216-Pyramimonas_sp.AAC.3